MKKSWTDKTPIIQFLDDKMSTFRFDGNLSNVLDVGTYIHLANKRVIQLKKKKNLAITNYGIACVCVERENDFIVQTIFTGTRI